MHDIIIIGAGPAGLTAAIYAGRAGIRPLVIEKLAAGGQIANTHLLENYPGFPEGVNGQDFSELLKKQAERFGAEFVSDEILSAELTGETKKLKGYSREYEGKTVIIAGGAVPRKLGIPGEEDYIGMGISFCATCDGMFFRNMETAVIGGGDTALADAIYLSNLCKKVYIVHRRDEFRASKLLVSQAESKENIEFVMDSIPQSFFGELDFGGIELLNKKTDETTRLEVQGCFEAVGYDPDTAYFSELELDRSGYIIAGEDTKTNIPGVFAAGDIRTKRLRQVVTAAADGAVAADEAASYIEEKWNK